MCRAVTSVIIIYPEKQKTRDGNSEKQNNLMLEPLYVVRKSGLASDAFVLGMPKGRNKEDKGVFVNTWPIHYLIHARSTVCAPPTKFS